MPKNTTAHQNRIQHAMRVLLKNCNLRVPEALKVADFSKKDVANESIHQAIQRCKITALAAEGLHTPPCECIVNGNRASLLDISDLADAQTTQTSTTTTMVMMTMAGTTTTTTSTDNAIPPPKHKQIRLPLHSVRQKHTNNLKAKRHKADAHKSAVRLYVIERQKPDGMSARHVAKKIEEKYGCVAPHYSTIFRYANKGLVNASSKKMGPVGNILDQRLHTNYCAMHTRALCQSTSSILAPVITNSQS
jgi:hypothetical protein